MSATKLIVGTLVVLALALALPSSSAALCGNKTCYNLDTGPECNFSLYFFNQDCRDGIGWCYSESCATQTEGEIPDAIASRGGICEDSEMTEAKLPSYELRAVPPRT